jgi:hypothetical protein
MAGPKENKVIAYIRELDTFQCLEVANSVGITRREALRILDRLTKNGYLEVVEERRRPLRYGEYGPKRRNPIYRRLKDVEKRTSPRTDRKNRKSERGRCRDAIWRTLRIKRIATLSELMVLTGCAESVCRDYIIKLKRYGFVAVRGKKGRENRLVLIKDTGPKRPDTPEHKGKSRDVAR